MAGIGYPLMREAGQQLLQFGHVFITHHIAALRSDQPCRHTQTSDIGVEVVDMKARVRSEYGALIARVQPFSA